MVVDEIHTPDSSRYWVADGYGHRFAQGADQQMLDKEFVRQWLIERGFMGEGVPPVLTNELKISAARRYIELYEKVTGMQFAAEQGDVESRIRKNLIKGGLLE